MIDNAPFSCSVEPVDLTDQFADTLLSELAALCCFAFEVEGCAGDWEVALVFTNDAHLTVLHEQFLGVRAPTDIMTFPNEEGHGGDVVISVDQAERQRVDDGWSLASELGFLVAHGALHLAGWDDSSTADRTAMLDRQRAILAQFHSNEPSSSR